MTTTITPSTELEAVNAILATIGELPINSLPNTGLGDASLAYTLLSDVSREVQTHGWSFNREYEFPITPDILGQILIPPNALQVTIADTQAATYDIVWRGKRMYDRKNRTYAFTQTVKLNMTVALTFEDLPQAARWYITVRAARRFLDRTVGTESLHTYSADDEKTALVMLQDAEAETENFNLLTGNYTVFRTLDRGQSTFSGVTLIIQ